MKRKIEVGILGATGLVGQHFVNLLRDHPWFELKWLAASERSAQRKYGEAASWRLADPMPDNAAKMMVEECAPSQGPQIVFSALDSKVAGEIEAQFAASGHLVVSNAGNYRMEPDVPLLVPEINPDHLNLAKQQKPNRGWKGSIVTNPNCSTVVLTMALAPLVNDFGLRKALVTTMQAISGAGYPGLPSMDALGNIIPFIGGPSVDAQGNPNPLISSEEDKIERETRKILGQLKKKAVEPAKFLVSAQANRVPVLDGHTESISVELEAKPSLKDLVRCWNGFRGIPQKRKLPSAPPQPVIFLAGQDRPQPRLDVMKEGGMTVFVGRARPCSVLQFRFVAMGHNVIRGAAGAALLNAELMKSEGWLP
ncbi:MAG: aspartate-semialdehyde dehydrogenase family protein [Acidobacteria bacterium]|nr:aspartate-semialdehyde dehydrogenase family protein [Acidobacteriota bacterium]